MKKYIIGLITVLVILGLTACSSNKSVSGKVISATSNADVGVISFKLQSKNSETLFLLTDETSIKSKTSKFPSDDFKKSDICNLSLDVQYNKNKTKSIDENGNQVDAYNVYKIIIIDVLPEYNNAT